MRQVIDDGLRRLQRGRVDLLHGHEVYRNVQCEGKSATLTHGSVSAALRELNAWVALLSEDEQRQLTEEIESLLWSATELGEYRRLLESFCSWTATAEAYAAGLPRDDGDLTWLPDLPVVTRP